MLLRVVGVGGSPIVTWGLVYEKLTTITFVFNLIILGKLKIFCWVKFKLLLQ